MNEPREQLLISRLTDADASDQEWREFEVIAEADPALWTQLAQTQRDQAALARAMDRAAAMADSVGVPAILHPTAALAIQAGPRPRLARLGAWSGWAAAAAIAIVASGRFGQPGNTTPNQPTNGVQTAGLNLSLSELRQAYLDKGKASGEVIGEMPTKVLLESRPAPSGSGYELVYLRQVMERAIVPDLYQVNGQNELGQPTLGRYEQPVSNSM